MVERLFMAVVNLLHSAAVGRERSDASEWEELSISACMDLIDLIQYAAQVLPHLLKGMSSASVLQSAFQPVCA